MNVDAHANIAAMYSQLGALLIGQRSVFQPSSWQKTNLHVTDETSELTAVRSGTQWGGTARFIINKRPTLVHEHLVKIVLQANGVGAAVPASAFFVNNFGDQILTNVTHRYGNHVLQEYDGEYQQLWQRLTTNEVNEEGRNALSLGGLPHTVGLVPEQARDYDLFQAENTRTIYVPLNRLWYAQHLDEAWMPEAYATEAEIELKIARLEDLIYNSAAPGTDPFALAADKPTIQSISLIQRETTLTIPEKQQRLSHFETDMGLLVMFLDLERQRRVSIIGTGAAPPPAVNANREFRIRLDNVRLDMCEILFVVREGDSAGRAAGSPALDKDWAGDNLQAPVYDITTGLVAPASNGADIAVLYDGLVSFRLEANGKRLTDDVDAFLNRSWQRKMYHADSQVKDPIHHKSFSLNPENTKMITGFQNAANLGNLELVLTMPDPHPNYPKIVDVWVHAYNVVQSRRGDVVKSLK